MKSVSIRTCAAALGAAALLSACATASDTYATGDFVVLEEHAQIPFASMINEYRRVDNDTLLFRVGANQWYRAEMSQPCATELFGPEAIGIETQGVAAVNDGSSVTIGGLRCPIEQLDRISPPERVSAQGAASGSESGS